MIAENRPAELAGWNQGIPRIELQVAALTTSIRIFFAENQVFSAKTISDLYIHHCYSYISCRRLRLIVLYSICFIVVPAGLQKKAPAQRLKILFTQPF